MEGNALLRRGEILSAKNQSKNVKVVAREMPQIVADNEIIIAHGNSPQVGLLALQAIAYTEITPYPLDILSTETEEMIGYLI